MQLVDISICLVMHLVFAELQSKNNPFGVKAMQRVSAKPIATYGKDNGEKSRSSS